MPLTPSSEGKSSPPTGLVTASRHCLMAFRNSWLSFLSLFQRNVGRFPAMISVSSIIITEGAFS